jgi:hypothetical protein
MAVRSGGKHQHVEKGAECRGHQNVAKITGVFINSISTSSEPLFQETVRVKLKPAKSK